MRESSRIWLLLACQIAASPWIGGAAADPMRSACGTSEQVIAFTDVEMVPMTDDRVVPDQTVVVCGETIVEVGPSAEVPVPPNTEIIEGRGAYLLPGLADMHMHTRADWLGGTWPVSPFDLYLANGVTTIRNFGAAGSSPEQALLWRDRIAKGELMGPRMLVGAVVGKEPIKDLRRHIRWRATEGYDFIKLYSFLTYPQFKEAVRAAEEVGKGTVGHIPFAVGLDGVLAAGMDEIAHIEELDFEFLDFDRSRRLHPLEWLKYVIEAGAQQTAPFETADGLDLQRYNDAHPGKVAGVVERLRAADIPVSTTLVVGETVVMKLLQREEFLARPENRYLPVDYRAVFDRGEEKHLFLFQGQERFAQSKHALERMLLRKLAQAGIPLLLATDAGTGSMGIVPGFSLHDELRLLTENGLTPYEAIAAGTVVASRVAAKMTGADAFGTIEPGKRADLLLVRDNPLADVGNLADPIGVMAAGRWYPRTRLREMIGLDR